eukprot:30994-Pelagococcus_subviridis.AAC.2
MRRYFLRPLPHRPVHAARRETRSVRVLALPRDRPPPRADNLIVVPVVRYAVRYVHHRPRGVHLHAAHLAPRVQRLRPQHRGPRRNATPTAVTTPGACRLSDVAHGDAAVAVARRDQKPPNAHRGESTACAAADDVAARVDAQARASRARAVAHVVHAHVPVPRRVRGDGDDLVAVRRERQRRRRRVAARPRGVAAHRPHPRREVAAAAADERAVARAEEGDRSNRAVVPAAVASASRRRGRADDGEPTRARARARAPVQKRVPVLRRAENVVVVLRAG